MLKVTTWSNLIWPILYLGHDISAMGKQPISKARLLGQANLTQNDVLQFHPFTSE
jgi:hypothetical protein